MLKIKEKQDKNPGYAKKIGIQVKITENENIYELEFKGFGFSYSKLEKFLNKFNSEIIYIDNKNIENVIIADESEEAAFKRIFNQ